MNTFNENLKEEMESIAWTSPKETKNEINNELQPASEQHEINTTESVTIENTTENTVEDKKDKAKIIDSNKGNEKPAAQKKKRNINVVGDKEWASKIPEDQKLDEKTIICFDPNKIRKIGPFVQYGKKEGIIWFLPYKKGSFEFMTRKWAVSLAECDIVEKNGVLLMPEKYYKDDKGYHLIKQETKSITETENKEAETNTEPVIETESNSETAVESDK